VHPKFRTPYLSTIFTGVAVGLATGVLPLQLLGQLVNIGTLLAFVLVCAGVWILRGTRPDLDRPFKTPLMPFVPIMGILCCPRPDDDAARRHLAAPDRLAADRLRHLLRLRPRNSVLQRQLAAGRHPIVRASRWSTVVLVVRERSRSCSQRCPVARAFRPLAVRAAAAAAAQKPATKPPATAKAAPKAAAAAEARLLDLNTATRAELVAPAGHRRGLRRQDHRRPAVQGKSELVSKKIVPAATYKQIVAKVIAHQAKCASRASGPAPQRGQELLDARRRIAGAQQGRRSPRPSARPRHPARGAPAPA
jgi:hypothetical protein